MRNQCISASLFTVLILILNLGLAQKSFAANKLLCEKLVAPNGPTLIESIFTRLTERNYSFGRDRKRQRDELFVAIYEALWGFKEIPIVEIRDLTWRVLSQPQRRLAFLDTEFKAKLLSGYLRRIERAKPGELEIEKTDLIDWLRLKRIFDPVDADEFKTSLIPNLRWTLVSTIQNTLGIPSDFSSDEVAEITVMLRNDFVARKVNVAKTLNGSGTQANYMTAERVADNMIHLINIEILRKDKNFQQLVGEMIAYLRADKDQSQRRSIEIADELERAIQQK